MASIQAIIHDEYLRGRIDALADFLDEAEREQFFDRLGLLHLAEDMQYDTVLKQRAHRLDHSTD